MRWWGAVVGLRCDYWTAKSRGEGGRRPRYAHCGLGGEVEHCCWGGGDSAVEEELGGHLLRFGEDVVLLCLRGEHAFCFVAVTFSFPVFLVGVLDGDVFVHEVLPVHVRDRVVGGFEGAVGDEAVAFAEAGLVSCDLGGRLEGAEAGECVVEGFLVDEGVEVSYEELGAYFDGFLLVC